MQFTLSASLLALVVAAVAIPTKRAVCSNGRTTAHASCCVWFDVLDDIQENLFDGAECGEETHESLRLTFHDAIGFSPALKRAGKFGQASFLRNLIQMAYLLVEKQWWRRWCMGPSWPTLILRPCSRPTMESVDNLDLGMEFEAYTHHTDDIVDTQRPFALAHKVFLRIQFAGAVGVSNCVGAPRLEFLAGRSNISTASPPDLVPDPFNPVDQIIARFADAGFTPNEIVDLLASHTIAAQDHVDPTIPVRNSIRFDPRACKVTIVPDFARRKTFPGNGSNQGEVVSPLAGEFRLQSDFAIARDPRMACEWQSFRWQSCYDDHQVPRRNGKDGYVGPEPQFLTDCSDVIPVPKTLTTKPFLPAGKTHKDVQVACHATPFPVLTTARPGPATSVAPVPPS
ncbi:heme peroxidase [Mycena olivaceomarginata]|nr:heme peroxidase [Mycena olivaceomarginata]